MGNADRKSITSPDHFSSLDRAEAAFRSQFPRASFDTIALRPYAGAFVLQIGRAEQLLIPASVALSWATLIMAGAR